jgi:hypothetical protein
MKYPSDTTSSDTASSDTASFDLSSLAAALSLTLTDDRDRVVLSRHGFALTLPAPVVDALDAHTPVGRHLAFGVLFGVRLAIDRSAAGFDLARERPQKPAKVFHHHEIPSVYGERLPRLVPALVLQWFEALTGLAPVTSSWHIDGLHFVYILETGKYLHLLAESDVERLDMTRNRIISDARHALFYDAYKLKPRHKEQTAQGRVRTFRTSEGLGASRAMLLPDFDYDAARESGCFSIPSRDTMVIGRPVDTEFSEVIFERVSKVTAELVESEAFPLCSMVYTMSANEVGEPENVGEHRLPVSAYDMAVCPHDGARLVESNTSQ